MNYLLLSVSLMLGSFKNISSKLAGNKSGIKGLASLGIVTALVAVVVFATGGLKFTYLQSLSFILLSAGYGICTLLSQSMYIIAVQKGSVSVCSMIYSCGFLIPTFFSFFAYNEELTVFKIMGVLLLVASIILISGRDNKSKSNLYLAFAFLAMAASGTVGILQKVFMKSFGNDGLNTFLFTSFAFMLVISSVLRLSLGGNTEKINIFSLVLALCTVFANKINLFLSGELPGIIFFPVVNGGVIAISAVLSFFILKERISKRKWSGIALSIAAICLSFM